MSLNDERVKDLLESINFGNLHFNEIQEELSWSSATLTRYLKKLRNRGFLEKEITEDDRAGYKLTETGVDYLLTLKTKSGFQKIGDKRKDKEAWIDSFTQAKERISYLNDLGIFDEEIDINNLEGYVESFHDVENPNKVLLLDLFFVLEDLNHIIGDAPVKGKLKIEADGDEAVSAFEKIIRKIEEEGIEEGKPAFLEESED